MNKTPTGSTTASPPSTPRSGISPMAK